MEIPILKDIVTIFALSIVVLLICRPLKIPSVVGFLITGVVCGPHGLGLINAVDQVEVLSEIGVILLLFTIGLEFSLTHLWEMKKLVLVGGLLQVIITVLVTAGVAVLLKVPLGQAVFFGFLVSLSSTAILLKVLQEKGQVETVHGKSIIAILILQDIVIVPMMLITPYLNEGQSIDIMLLLKNLLFGVYVLAGILIAARFLIPRLLFEVAKTKNNQLFILSVLCICFSIAWLTSEIGLSLALGAFITGLIISESKYAHQAVGQILPFQKVFTSFFFVSIGMLLDVSFLISHFWQTLGLVIFVVALKSVIAGLVMRFLKYPYRVCFLVGLSLAQVGEFAFILSAEGVQHGLIEGDVYQLFLSVSLLTMALAPYLLQVAPWLALKIPFPLEKMEDEGPKDQKQDHIVLVGMGMCGRNVAWAARLANVPYVILEMNPEIVQKERKKGEPVYFGDGTQRSVLQNLNLDKARLVVIAIDDPIASRRMIELMRDFNKDIYIVVRTRYLKEVKPLIELGADDVISEEFETSIEIFARVLGKYLIPQEEIKKYIMEARSSGYQVLRHLEEQKSTLLDLTFNVANMEIGVFRLPQYSPLVEKSLQGSRLRQIYGLSLLMIRRGEETISNPCATAVFEAQDLLVLFGKEKDLQKFKEENKLISERKKLTEELDE
jgi:monovalent cation:H+ antiporter-2, CPA2 family